MKEIVTIFRKQTQTSKTTSIYTNHLNLFTKRRQCRDIADGTRNLSIFSQTPRNLDYVHNSTFDRCLAIEISPHLQTRISFGKKLKKKTHENKRTLNN